MRCRPRLLALVLLAALAVATASCESRTARQDATRPARTPALPAPSGSAGLLARDTGLLARETATRPARTPALPAPSGSAGLLARDTGLLARETGASPARRIVSVVPAVTEMLFAIGAGPQVVAVSSFDNWPPEVRSLTRVGALLDPDIERILRLRPDLVVVYGTQSGFQTTLERAGIRTFPYVMGGLDNLMATIRRLGPVVGRAREANRVADGLQARFDAIRARAAGTRRPRTLLVFGREPGTLRSIDASGGVGFLADIVSLAGGDNVFGAERRESIRVSTESILAAAPEVIIDLHYGRPLGPDEIDRERSAWNVLSAVPAVRDGRVAVLVGDKFVVPGPRLADAAEAIAEVIHPGGRR